MAQLLSQTRKAHYSWKSGKEQSCFLRELFLHRLIVRTFPFLRASELYLTSDTMLLVDINDLLHLIIASQENTASIVDMLRNHLEHSPHLTVDRLAPGYSMISILNHRTTGLRDETYRSRISSP